MVIQKEYNGKCWWCGNTADSGEHKIKKTDFIKVYGKGPYRIKNDQPLLVKGDIEIPIQSPDSKHIKFNKNLCSDCNNSKSSNSDRAYTEFMTFIFEKADSIIESQYVDLVSVYNESWEKKTKDLFRYWAKHAGCRIAEHGYQVPQNIVDFLNGDSDLKDLNFRFEYREYNSVLSKSISIEANFKQVYLGAVSSFASPVEVKCVLSWYTLNWFSCNYVFEKNINTSGTQNLSKLKVNIIPIISYPPLTSLKSTAEIINKLENWDKRETREIQLNFLEAVRSEKYTL